MRPLKRGVALSAHVVNAICGGIAGCFALMSSGLLRRKRGRRVVLSQSRRLVHAAVSLALGFGTISSVAFLQDYASALVGGVQVSSDAVEYLLAKGNPSRLSDMGDDTEELIFRLFEGNAGHLNITWNQAPEAFVEEVLDPNSLGAANVASAHGTVAFVCGGSVATVSDEVQASMEENGWTLVQVGSDSPGVTFVKGEGAYRWAYVTCSEISGTVTVSVSVMGVDDVA